MWRAKIFRFFALHITRTRDLSKTCCSSSSSWLSKDDKPDFLAKYSSNQNEPKNKNIDNKIIDIFAVNELSPESSGEDIEDEKWKKVEYSLYKRWICKSWLLLLY